MDKADNNYLIELELTVDGESVAHPSMVLTQGSSSRLTIDGSTGDTSRHSEFDIRIHSSPQIPDQLDVHLGIEYTSVGAHVISDERTHRSVKLNTTLAFDKGETLPETGAPS